MIRLRKWQAECVSLAITKYTFKQDHFLCLATPGAGKTIMTAELVAQLFNQKMIDLVVCISPSVNVARDFRKVLEQHTGLSFAGGMGSKGCSLTYQAMLNLGTDFWSIFERYRILVIFDEIHHCAGLDQERSNSWGQKIVTMIQGRATFTLALTGTPWRSDKIPISLSTYCQNGQIHCDYVYGLPDAVKNRVCRTPQIHLVDNDLIRLMRDDEEECYRSISDFMSNYERAYLALIENVELIGYMLRKSNELLNNVRRHSLKAAGLIVASSVKHAFHIAQILKENLQENSTIVTYQSEEAQSLIDEFKKGDQKWVISVGMISEGTNIPRLQVCCYLTRIRTELHFRQVLGRVLRHTGFRHEFGHFVVPAVQDFVEFSQRIAEEIPEAAAARICFMNTSSVKIQSPLTIVQQTSAFTQIQLDRGNMSHSHSTSSDGFDLQNLGLPKLSLFGKYRTELLSLFD